jgi:hypothetical protein
MDYSKIDAPLSEALSESPAKDKSQLLVFIHTNRDLNQEEAAELHSLGVTGSAQQRIVTAKLSPTNVDELSHKPWIRSIKLSQKLRPLDGD